MPQDNLNATEKAWTIIVGLMAVIQTVGLGIAAWLLLAVISMQNDMSGIKANRFTIQDGYEMDKKFAGEILGLWRQIEAVKSDVRSISERKP